MADEDETLPWDSTFNESWRNAVNGWEWRSIGGDDWEKSGKCPRCDHGIDVTKQGSYSLAPPAEDVLETIVEAERGPLLTEAEQFSLLRRPAETLTISEPTVTPAIRSAASTAWRIDSSAASRFATTPDLMPRTRWWA